KTNHTSIVTTGQPKRSGTPCAMALRLTPCSPRRPGFLASVDCRLVIGRLDPSVGGSGPHGLTVRDRAARLAARPRPSHPAPDVRDDRDAPSCGRGTASLNHNFRLSERQIFLREGLDSSGKTGGVFLVLCPSCRRGNTCAQPPASPRQMQG